MGDIHAWPREVKTASTVVVMYEPQLEQATENEVQARAAVQVTRTGKEPVFGAVWISARVDIDRDARVVSFRDIQVPKVRFVDASEDERTDLAKLLEQQMPTWHLTMALDEYIPLLDLAAHDSAAAAGIKNGPPRIIIASEPTTLVLMDGPPRQQPLTEPDEAAQYKLERVVNTPALMIYDPGRKSYFLAGGGDLWYSAPQATGPYAPVSGVPAVIAGLAPAADTAQAAATGKPPRILVATEPTEIVVVTGEPQYVPIDDLDLLAVSNADADIIVDTKSKAHYLLLSGRWYRSPNKLEGPWSFVPPGLLPAEFAQIPPKSDQGHVLAHVPGTVEAQEALLDNTVPETQAIRRDDKSLKVVYDGDPIFKDVEGAPGIQYAVNTAIAVFKLGGRYYACDAGVWYESSSPTGPWIVSISVPREIYNIPASNPHYNVTYVRVYDVTPDVVYVGYTPGYLGSYPYYGCIVYGTGWYYPGWYGTVYYPWPLTWGYRAVYNPYYGWGFGIGWSTGPVIVSIGFGAPYRGYWGYPGWWGPWGYRPYYPPYRTPYYPGYRPPYYPGYRPPTYPGYRPRPGQRPGTPAQLPAGISGPRPTDRGIYRRNENAPRNQPARPGAGTPGTRPSQQPNNIFSTPGGEVYRQNRSGQWDQRKSGTWHPSPGAGGGGGPTTKPTTPAPRPTAPTTRPTAPAAHPAGPSAGGLNRDAGARQRGAARSGAAPRPTTRR